MDHQLKKDEWIWIQGLKGAKELNGKLGQVVKYNEGKYRYEVFIPGLDCPSFNEDSLSQAILAKRQNDGYIQKLFQWKDGKPQEGSGSRLNKLIKSDNLVPYEGKLVECQYVAPGVPFGSIQSCWFPREHPMFLIKIGNSPILNLCEFPLIVVRYPYNRQSHPPEHYSNQFAAYMLIDVKDGLAPSEWQSNIGPILVYRPQIEEKSVQNFNSLDFEILWDFFNKILHQFGGGPGKVVAKRDFTFKKLKEFTERYFLTYKYMRPEISLDGQNITRWKFGAKEIPKNTRNSTK